MMVDYQQLYESLRSESIEQMLPEICWQLAAGQHSNITAKVPEMCFQPGLLFGSPDNFD